MYKVGNLMFIPISDTPTFCRTESDQKFIAVHQGGIVLNSIVTEAELLKAHPSAEKFKHIVLTNEG